MGKCTDRLDVPMPPDMKQRIGVIAALHGQNAAEHVRDLIDEYLNGKWNVIQRNMRRGNCGGDGRNGV